MITVFPVEDSTMEVVEVAEVAADASERESATDYLMRNLKVERFNSTETATSVANTGTNRLIVSATPNDPKESLIPILNPTGMKDKRVVVKQSLEPSQPSIKIREIETNVMTTTARSSQEPRRELHG